MYSAQVSNYTQLNRHPDFFRAAGHVMASRGLAAGRRPRVLSFGCSTGEELISLRLHFPDADLYGCDVSAGAIGCSTEAGRLIGATVFESTEENLARLGPFDIVFANSVLCRNPPTGIREAFPFSTFEQMLELLEGVLVDGGLLIVFNASYRFRKAAVAARFAVAQCDNTAFCNHIGIYDENSVQIARAHSSDQGFYFLRPKEGDDLTFSDLVDGIFIKGAQGRIAYNVPAPFDLDAAESIARFDRWSSASVFRGDETLVDSFIRTEVWRTPADGRTWRQVEVSWRDPETRKMRFAARHFTPLT